MTLKGEALLEADQMAVVFFNDGTLTTSLGICKHRDYSNVKNIFVMSAKTPLYCVSDFLGYAKIRETWEELKA